MSARLPSAMLVGALLRRVNDTGGIGVMLARGDAQGGAILVIAVENGRSRALERGIGADGKVALIAWTPQDMGDSAGIAHYWRQRRKYDPDLWVIELDTPFAERFTAETILVD